MNFTKKINLFSRTKEDGGDEELYLKGRMIQLFILSEPNHLLRLLYKFPEKNWNMLEVSRNPNITWENVSYERKDVLTNKQIKWDEHGISENPNVTITHVINNPTFPWNWNVLSLANPNTTKSIVDKHPTLPWVSNFWYHNSNVYQVKYSHPNVENELESFLERLNDGVRSHVCADDFITWDLVNKHQNWKWSWTGLSRNPNITFKIILQNYNKPWSWHDINHNPNITFNDVKREYTFRLRIQDASFVHEYSERTRAESEYPWDFKELSSNLF